MVYVFHIFMYFIPSKKINLPNDIWLDHSRFLGKELKCHRSCGNGLLALGKGYQAVVAKPGHLAPIEVSLLSHQIAKSEKPSL